MSAGGGDSEDPERDMLRRYEQMVQTQVDTLNGIDDKAAYTARLIALLIGIFFTGTSILITADQLALSTETGSALLTAALALIALVVSMTYAIFTYLSSRFEYGPSPAAGLTLAEKDIPADRYKTMMLRTYSEILTANYAVVLSNIERFEVSLAGLMVGILFLSATGVLLVLPGGLVVDGFVVLVSAAVSYRVAKYILEQEYIALDRQPVAND